MREDNGGAQGKPITLRNGIKNVTLAEVPRDEKPGPLVFYEQNAFPNFEIFLWLAG